MTEAIALRASTLRSRSARLVSDDRLVNRASKGDEQAFAVIYDRYHQDLFRYCQAMLGNASDAQDALQNAMVKALQALPGERREIKLKPWLYRIAHNEAINVMRRRHPSADIDTAALAALDLGPYESAETKERLDQLASDLGELPERQRSALVLRELSGLSFEEIGAALGATPAVVRQTIYEARTSLQQMKVGREMSCETVKQTLSDDDGRILRRRDMRAHLGACESCAEFEAGIAARQRDLAALSPLPAVASAGLLHGVLAGSQGGSGAGLAGTVGGGAAKTLAASTLLKSAAAVVAVTAVGVTAADRGGLVHLGSIGQRNNPSSSPGHSTLVSPDIPRVSGPSQPSAALREPLANQVRSRRQATPQEKIAAGRKLASEGSAPKAASDTAGNSTETAAIPSSHGSSGALPAAASHGQETAAAHQPELPAAAQNHPRSTHHPGSASPSSNAASHAKPHPVHPSPPAASHGVNAGGAHGKRDNGH